MADPHDLGARARHRQESVRRGRRRHEDARRRREPGTDRQIPTKEQVEPGELARERRQHTFRIVGPTMRRIECQLIERDFDLGLAIDRRQSNLAIGARAGERVGPAVDRDREDETLVVVEMSAEQIHSPRREERRGFASPNRTFQSSRSARRTSCGGFEREGTGRRKYTIVVKSFCVPCVLAALAAPWLSAAGPSESPSAEAQGPESSPASRPFRLADRISRPGRARRRARNHRWRDRERRARVLSDGPRGARLPTASNSSIRVHSMIGSTPTSICVRSPARSADPESPPEPNDPGARPRRARAAARPSPTKGAHPDSRPTAADPVPPACARARAPILWFRRGASHPARFARGTDRRCAGAPARAHRGSVEDQRAAARSQSAAPDPRRYQR